MDARPDNRPGREDPVQPDEPVGRTVIGGQLAGRVRTERHPASMQAASGVESSGLLHEIQEVVDLIGLRQ